MYICLCNGLADRDVREHSAGEACSVAMVYRAALHAPDGKRPVIIVDNTMLGPIYQSPLAHGADLVGLGP
jgi:hypothetical protein